MLGGGGGVCVRGGGGAGICSPLRRQPFYKLERKKKVKLCGEALVGGRVQEGVTFSFSF